MFSTSSCPCHRWFYWLNAHFLADIKRPFNIKEGKKIPSHKKFNTLVFVVFFFCLVKISVLFGKFFCFFIIIYWFVTQAEKKKKQFNNPSCVFFCYFNTVTSNPSSYLFTPSFFWRVEVWAYLQNPGQSWSPSQSLVPVLVPVSILSPCPPRPLLVRSMVTATRN